MPTARPRPPPTDCGTRSRAAAGSRRRADRVPDHSARIILPSRGRLARRSGCAAGRVVADAVRPRDVALDRLEARTAPGRHGVEGRPLRPGEQQAAGPSVERWLRTMRPASSRRGTGQPAQRSEPSGSAHQLRHLGRRQAEELARRGTCAASRAGWKRSSSSGCDGVTSSNAIGQVAHRAIARSGVDVGDLGAGAAWRPPRRSRRSRRSRALGRRRSHRGSQAASARGSRGAGTATPSRGSA